jgi:hypothetical protein
VPGVIRRLESGLFCEYNLRGKERGSYGGLYYTSLIAGNVSDVSPSDWSNTEAYCLNYVLDTTSTLVAPCSDFSSCTGHNATGYMRKYYGKHYSEALYSNPLINGVMNPGTKILTASLPCDDHGSYRNADTSDDKPIFSSTTDVPGWPTSYISSALCRDHSGEVGRKWVNVPIWT